MKKLALLGILIGSLTMTGCVGFNSWMKDVQSNTIGIDRTVEVYSYDGELLRKYEGRLTVEGNGNRTKITTLDAKRYIIDGGIVITEEK